MVPRIDVQWQADLVEMREFSDFNDKKQVLKLKKHLKKF